MRLVACAVAAWALGAMTSAPAAAQCDGPECESARPSPARYYTQRPPEDGPRQDADRPPDRGVAGDQGPRPWPSYDSPNRRPEAPYRRVREAPPPSNSYRRFWDERDDRRGRSASRDRRPDVSDRRLRETRPVSSSYRRFWDDRDDRRGRPTARIAPAPREYAPPPQRITRGPSEPPLRRNMPPVGRGAAGPGEMVISVAEYRALRDQIRELHRMLGERGELRDDRRRDFHDDRRPDFRDDRQGREFGPREIYR